MRFYITEDILKDATKCKNNYSCLSGETLCEIDDCSEEKIHFIVPGRKANLCDYGMVFGYSFTCNCPVRKGIYSKYKM
jgi:hypothetical protein